MERIFLQAHKKYAKALGELHQALMVYQALRTNLRAAYRMPNFNGNYMNLDVNLERRIKNKASARIQSAQRGVKARRALTAYRALTRHLPGNTVKHNILERHGFL
jgi:hypothetical protein